MLHTSVRQNIWTRKLTFENGAILETTDEHPLYVEGRGFVKAKEVGIGSSIVTRAGPGAKVVGVQADVRQATVYNFTVDAFHTYFVGSQALWVHNTDCGDVLSAFQKGELSKDETIAGAEIAQRGSTKTEGQFFFGKENIARRFEIGENEAKLPEGLIERNDGMFVAFEVKNQRSPDVGNAVGTFEDTVRLARQNNMEMGRLDFFISSRFEGFNDANYSIGNVFLQFQGQPVTIGGLKVNVIIKDLPVQ